MTQNSVRTGPTLFNENGSSRAPGCPLERTGLKLSAYGVHLSSGQEQLLARQETIVDSVLVLTHQLLLLILITSTKEILKASRCPMQGSDVLAVSGVCIHALLVNELMNPLSVSSLPVWSNQNSTLF